MSVKAIAQLDTDLKSADLYFEGDAWNIAFVLKFGNWQVIGPGGSRQFPTIDSLMNTDDLPDLVKWVARGLNSIPR